MTEPEVEARGGKRHSFCRVTIETEATTPEVLTTVNCVSELSPRRCKPPLVGCGRGRRSTQPGNAVPLRLQHKASLCLYDSPTRRTRICPPLSRSLRWVLFASSSRGACLMAEPGGAGKRGSCSKGCCHGPSDGCSRTRRSSYCGRKETLTPGQPTCVRRLLPCATHSSRWSASSPTGTWWASIQPPTFGSTPTRSRRRLRAPTRAPIPYGLSS